MPEPEKKEVELTKKGETFKVRKGAYHHATGIPEDEPIPMSQIEKDIEKGGKIGRMARSAKGFKAMHHKGESERRVAGTYPPARMETRKLSPVTPNQILAALREMSRGRATVREVAKALTEATVNFTDFTTGSKVYIIAGPGAGYRGTLKEIRQGFATVSGNMGNFWFVPTIFLTADDQNAPSGNKNPYGDNAGALAGNASRSGTV